jgi:hypothetical protein
VDNGSWEGVTDLADEAVAVLGVGDDGGGGAAALGVGHDGGRTTLHGGDLR